jgi:hypothetical protein
MTNYPEDPNQPGNLPVTSQPASGSRRSDAVDDMATTIRDFVTKVPETINKAVERALNVRDTSVLLRIAEPASEALDMLVTAGIFKSRAEAAAFLIDEGIKAQTPLFARIHNKMTEIERLRDELRHSLSSEP